MATAKEQSLVILPVTDACPAREPLRRRVTTEPIHKWLAPCTAPLSLFTEHKSQVYRNNV